MKVTKFYFKIIFSTVLTVERAPGVGAHLSFSRTARTYLHDFSCIKLNYSRVLFIISAQGPQKQTFVRKNLIQEVSNYTKQKKRNYKVFLENLPYGGSGRRMVILYSTLPEYFSLNCFETFEHGHLVDLSLIYKNNLSE
jgi:hypothetical protein